MTVPCQTHSPVIKPASDRLSTLRGIAAKYDDNDWTAITVAELKRFLAVVDGGHALKESLTKKDFLTNTHPLYAALEELK